MTGQLIISSNLWKNPVDTRRLVDVETTSCVYWKVMLEKRSRASLKQKKIKNAINYKITKYYYKPARIGGALDENQIKYESKGDGNETLSTEEYLRIPQKP